MLRRGNATQPRRSGRAAMLALAGAVLAVSAARADQGGASFWLPGQYGSFAAVAPDPAGRCKRPSMPIPVPSGPGSWCRAAGCWRAG